MFLPFKFSWRLFGILLFGCTIVLIWAPRPQHAQQQDQRSAADTAYQAALALHDQGTPEAVQAIFDGLRWLVKAVADAGTVDDATKIRAAMPSALAATKNMFGMSNLDETGDVDMPILVGVMSDGKLTAFSGAH